MGIFDRIKGKIKTPKKGGKAVRLPNGVEIKPGQGIFRIEALTFKKSRRGKPRKSWVKLYDVEVSEETLPLAQPDGYTQISSNSWATLKEMVENELAKAGIDPDLLDYYIVRLRYMPDPRTIAGSVTLWTVGFSVDDTGNVDVEPDPDIPDPRDLFEVEELAREFTRGPPQVDPTLINDPLQNQGFMQFQQFLEQMKQMSMFYEQMRQSIAEAFGIKQQSEEPEEVLERVLMKIQRYEELKKRLGMSQDKDIYEKMLDKMPWWAGLFMFSLQNLSPLLSLLGPMGGLMGGMPMNYGNPYAYNNPYAGAQPGYGQPQPGYNNQLPPKPAPPAPKPQPPAPKPAVQEHIQPAEEPRPTVVAKPREQVTEEAPVKPNVVVPAPPRPAPPKPKPKKNEAKSTPDEYRVDVDEVIKEFEEELKKVNDPVNSEADEEVEE